MDFGLAFSYVFNDKDWLKKISILSLVALIPIIGQMVVYGWMMKITKQVMNHDLNELPEMDFAEDLSRGFMGFVITLVYTLPIWLLYGLMFIFGFFGSSSGYDNTANVFAAFWGVCGGLLMAAYGIFLAFVIPAAFGKYLVNNSLSDAFDFSAVIKMVSKNLNAYLIVVLGTLLVGFIVPFGMIACVIGVMWTYTYSMAVQGHLYGQAYNEANREKMVVDIPPSSS